MAQTGHTYLKKHRLSGKVLAFDLGDETPALLEKARSSRAGRAAKTLVKEGPFRVTAVAIRRGTSLERHAVDGPVSIQSLMGRARLELDGESVPIPAKSLVTLRPGIEHSVSAATDCAILITMAME